MAADVARYNATARHRSFDTPNQSLAMRELLVRITGLQSSTTTYDIWKDFSMHGKVVWIELCEDKFGKRDGQAKTIFSPPPAKVFWAQGIYRFKPANGKSSYPVQVSTGGRAKSAFQVPSPLTRGVFYDDQMKISPLTLDFGVMLYPKTMMTMQTIIGDGPSDISFTLDLRRKKIITTFQVQFKDPRNDGSTDFMSTLAIGQCDRTSRYMFQIPFSNMKIISQAEINETAFSLIISLDSPPEFLRRREDEEGTHSDQNQAWSESECWFRQTDIVYDPRRLQTIPISLQKEAPVIDIGRWTTYRLVFHRSRDDDAVYEMMKRALQDFNIPIVPLHKLKIVGTYTAPLWHVINSPKAQHVTMELKNFEKGNASYILPFEVRYQLEACISSGVLNEYDVTNPFLNKLADIASKDSFKARTILEYMMEQDKRIYHPMKIFENKEALEYYPKTDIPHYCAYSRKTTITPTRIYFHTPTVEATNRVLRYYAREHEDGRFLHVQFTDEMSQGRINSSVNKKRNDELFTRIHRTLVNGVRIGERLYRFLAFGNSQFRDNGAYFFCPTDYLSCDDIRQWMGNFSHINVVAKYAARLGQCFSRTRAINALLMPIIVRIPDVEKGDHCFTDGVGKISPFLAQTIAAEFSLHLGDMPAPSAFQFRLGGCKGILVVSPDTNKREVHIRKSQEKFTAVYNGLEIIRCSQFCCATLNRQTITILSSLGVPDEVFLKMLSKQLSDYQNAMSSHTLALSLLSKYIDDNRTTINIARMILNGFMTKREPFVLSLLDLWRVWSIQLLKEKARIIVEKGAFVFGCVDETATLRGYSTQKAGKLLSREELPQIFIQVPNKNILTQYSVVEGICIVGRNPSLHPGDLRVVEAVNVPALHHLRDVVVFPQTGDKDIPGMCSGGDLDGDDYFVIWDEDLIPHPRQWNCEPMNYAAPTPKVLQRPVAVEDLMRFFVKYIKNDTLPTIAHAHLAQSDYLSRGVRDPKCLELAALHSKAVDYFKTGQPAEMPKHLHPTRWPHFMEKNYKPKNTLYHSRKVLGQLYDRVKRVSFVPQWQKPFDKRVLNAYKLGGSTLNAARQLKRKYDTAMLRIMAQQEIKTEFEVWTAFVLSKPRVGNAYKMQEVIAGISGSLKDQFRRVCIEAAGGKEFATLGPFVAAMYRVTKQELDIALAESRSRKYRGHQKVSENTIEPESMPLISFPWLFEKELGMIAVGVNFDHDLDDFSLLSLIPNKNTRSSRYRQGQNAENEIHLQNDGDVSVKRGEELTLFPEESDISLGDDDVFVGDEPDEASSTRVGSSSSIDLCTPQDEEAEEDEAPTTRAGSSSSTDLRTPQHEDVEISSSTDLRTPQDEEVEISSSTDLRTLQDEESEISITNLDSVNLPQEAEEEEDIIVEEISTEEHLQIEESPWEKLARLNSS